MNAGIPALKTALDGQTRVITGISYGNGLVNGHLGYAGHYAAAPVAYSAAPVAYSSYAAAPVVYSGYAASYAYGAHHLIGKREAEAEADAYTIGQVAAGLPYANAVATGHAHNPGYVAYTSLSAPAVYSGYAAPYSTYAHVAAPYAYGAYGAHHLIGKREAEAEADAYTIGQVAAGLPYANAVATGHAHNPGYIAYSSHSAPSVYAGYAAPYATYAHVAAPYAYGAYGAHHLIG